MEWAILDLTVLLPLPVRNGHLRRRSLSEGTALLLLPVNSGESSPGSYTAHSLSQYAEVQGWKDGMGDTGLVHLAGASREDCRAPVM